MERKKYLYTIVSRRTMFDGLHVTVNNLNAEICQLRKSLEAKDEQNADLIRLLAET